MQTFIVESLKGRILGRITQVGNCVEVMWYKGFKSTGPKMRFRGNATIIFPDGRAVLHVEFINGKLKTGAVIRKVDTAIDTTTLTAFASNPETTVLTVVYRNGVPTVSEVVRVDHWTRYTVVNASGSTATYNVLH